MIHIITSRDWTAMEMFKNSKLLKDLQPTDRYCSVCNTFNESDKPIALALGKYERTITSYAPDSGLVIMLTYSEAFTLKAQQLIRKGIVNANDIQWSKVVYDEDEDEIRLVKYRVGSDGCFLDCGWMDWGWRCDTVFN